MQAFYKSFQRFCFRGIFRRYLDLNSFFRFRKLEFKLLMKILQLLFAAAKHCNHLLSGSLFYNYRTMWTKKLLQETLNGINRIFVNDTAVHLPLSFAGNEACVLKLFKMMRDR